MFRETISSVLAAALGAEQFILSESRGDLEVDLARDLIPAACLALRDSKETAFDMLVDVTAVDRMRRKDRFEVVYLLWSNVFHTRVLLRTLTDDKTPVPTVCDIWPAANWGEREVYDMFGITFSGHPDLRRMYMPEDYNHPITGEPLYPLRKDFPLMGIDGAMPLPKRNAALPDSMEYHIPMATEEYAARKIDHPKILDALLNTHVQVEMDDALENDMILNLGPQHPATHGVLRLVLRLDGETVVNSVPELGYLHRGYEKIAESSTYHEFIPHTDRLDYISPVANNVAYAMAVEKLAGLQVPPRAVYIRTMVCELARISSHLMATGATAMDVGAITMLLWTFREREKLYDIFNIVTGVRFTTSYTRIGGLAQDIESTGIAMIKKFITDLPTFITEYEKLLNRNRIFVERMSGTGVLERDFGVAMGVTGPSLRASGIARDLRRDAPYLAYADLDFDVITRTEGDSLARYLCRLDEMKESVKIIRQCIDRLPEGPIYAEDSKLVLPRKNEIYTKMEELIDDFMLINFGINPPKGDSYSAVDSAKGELGFYFVSNGGGYPYRMKIRSPSYYNLQALPSMLKGMMLSDTVAVIGSLDPIMGEADK